MAARLARPRDPHHRVRVDRLAERLDPRLQLGRGAVERDDPLRRLEPRYHFDAGRKIRHRPPLRGVDQREPLVLLDPKLLPQRRSRVPGHQPPAISAIRFPAGSTTRAFVTQPLSVGGISTAPPCSATRATAASRASTATPSVRLASSSSTTAP